MVTNGLKSIEQLFWTMLWVLVILFLIVAGLRFFEGRGGALGNIADWVSSHTGLQS
jgi:hypothetical protein